MQTEQIILGIDTALGATSIALMRGDALLAQRFEADRAAQATHLLDWIEACLAQAGCDYDALDALSVTVGPGGFTGIRIGLAAARGIGLAAGKPVLGFSTLQVMAASLFVARNSLLEEITNNEQRITSNALLPAGRGMVYVQEFMGMQAQGDARMEELSRHCDTKQREGEAIQSQDAEHGSLRRDTPRDDVQIVTTLPDIPHAHHHDIHRNALILCALAQNNSAESLPPAPLYIRPPDAKLPSVALSLNS